jgi:hypothetical protein
MRIGFFGNPGNYPLMLARALARLGHEVCFTVSALARLERPENRYAEWAPPYPAWIRDFSPRWRTWLETPSRDECIRGLRECDVAVLSDIGPSLAGEIGRPAVALLTGSDAIHYADPACAGLLRELALGEPGWTGVVPGIEVFERLVDRQRTGIARAAVVAHFARGLVPEGDRMLDGLGVPDARRTSLLMTEPDRIAFAPPPRNATLRVFCAARLNWKRPIPPGLAELDYKGTDVMVKGIALFARESGTRLDLRLVRKGLHVAETEALVRDEGLADHVTWLEEMSQCEVQREFVEADIVFDQLGESVVAMAGLDAMATGRPLIANARPEVAQQGAGSAICQARTAREVASQLARLQDPAERERAGLASRRHVEAHYSAEAAARRLLESLSRAGVAAPAEG